MTVHRRINPKNFFSDIIYYDSLEKNVFPICLITQKRFPPFDDRFIRNPPWLFPSLW